MKYSQLSKGLLEEASDVLMDRMVNLKQHPRGEELVKEVSLYYIKSLIDGVDDVDL